MEDDLGWKTTLDIKSNNKWNKLGLSSAKLNAQLASPAVKAWSIKLKYCFENEVGPNAKLYAFGHLYFLLFLAMLVKKVGYVGYVLCDHDYY